MLRSLRWALLWALVILVLCLMPGKDVPHWDWADLFNLDKPVHAILFGILTYLLATAFLTNARFGRLHLHPAVSAVLLAVTYGILMEVMQGTMMMERTADVNDALANTVGALVAWWWWRRRHAVAKG